ncbi:MAG TPA: zinc ribbon domain-containing protein [Anaerolineales bacterium]|nr:zinc ribbon domain-containing protein [Anaerolineales bacterium]
MRRMFRRNIRKTLAQDVPPILQEANFAFDKGEYGRAAELFEQIAQTVGARGGRRAPLFYLQAGRARILAGQTALGMPSLKRGLELFALNRRFHRLHRAGMRVISDLNERGLKKEASEIETWLKTALTSAPSFPASKEVLTRPVLPTHCPACGAAVRPDDVEWLDDVTAECAYCGSPLREE